MDLTDLHSEVSADLRKDIAKREAELERHFHARNDELESCLPHGHWRFTCRCGCVGTLEREGNYSNWEWRENECDVMNGETK